MGQKMLRKAVSLGQSVAFLRQRHQDKPQRVLKGAGTVNFCGISDRFLGTRALLRRKMLGALGSVASFLVKAGLLITWPVGPHV